MTARIGGPVEVRSHGRPDRPRGSAAMRRCTSKYTSSSDRRARDGGVHRDLAADEGGDDRGQHLAVVDDEAQAGRRVGAASRTPGRRGDRADDTGRRPAPASSTSTAGPGSSSAASSAGRPKARSRPRCSTAMRWASRPASPRKWVHSTTVRPCSAASVADQVDDVAGGGRVEARGGLVEEQHLGVVQQRPGQGEALALAGREALHEVRRPGRPWRSARAARRLGRGPRRGAMPRMRAVELEVLGRGQPVVEPGVLGEHAGAAAHLVAVDAGVEPEHRRPAPVGSEHAVEQADRGGLAGAVRAEQGQHLAGAGRRGRGRRAPRRWRRSG